MIYQQLHTAHPSPPLLLRARTLGGVQCVGAAPAFLWVRSKAKRLSSAALSLSPALYPVLPLLLPLAPQ